MDQVAAAALSVSLAYDLRRLGGQGEDDLSKRAHGRPGHSPGLPTPVEELIPQGDFSWVAALLAQHRDEILDRWLSDAAAQPFHAGRRERAVADHIPPLFDALAALLRRTAQRGVQASAPLEDAAVLEAARAHARDRFRQGLAATEVLTEFRLLRQEIGRALRLHLDDTTPTRDVVSAEILVHDALDGAALLALDALGEQETASRRVEAPLRASEEPLRKALSARTVGVLFFRLDGRIVDANATFERMSGYTADELRAIVHWEVLTPPEFMEATARAAGQLAERGETAPYEKQLIRRDGSRWWGLFAPTRLAGRGRDAECMEFVIDITEAKRTEAALRESEERYRTLFESLDAGFCIIEVLFDADGRPTDYRFIEANPAFVRQTGLHDAVGKRVRELAPHHEARWFETYGRIALTGQPERFENEARELGRFYDVYAFPIGEPERHRVAVLFNDISPRRQAELERERLLVRERAAREQAEAAQERSAFLAAIVQSASAVIIGMTMDGVITSWNAGAEQLYGYTAEEAIGRNLDFLAPPDCVDEWTQLLARLGRGERILGYETRRRRKDGQLVDVLLSLAPVLGAAGQPLGIAVIAHDITGRKQAEAALAASEARYRRIVETAQEGIWTIDAEGRTTFANARMAEMLGYRPEEMLGQPLAAFLPEPELARSTASLRRRSAGVAEQGEYRLRRRDGAEVWALMANSPLFDASGHYLGALAMVTDITERRHAEQTQQLLAEASRVFAEAGLEPEPALETISRYVAQVLGDGAIAFLAAEDGQRLELAGLYHPDPEAMAQTRAILAASPQRPDDGLVGKVFRTGEPLLVSSLTNGHGQRMMGGWAQTGYLDHHGMRSVLIVPLRARGRVIGTLGVWREQGNCPHTLQDQQLLQELADRAGLAIDNARLFAHSQAAVRLRDEVLGAVSHDLKGPLAAIKGTTQLLQRRAAREGVSPDRLVEALERIDGAATRMSTWIEDLVDVAQLQAGRQLSLRLAAVDLVELTAQAVAEHQQTNQQHAIQLEARVPRLLGSFDPARLRRVLDNLLSNAIKYSPAGKPVRVCVDRQEDAAGVWAVLQVQDQGVGIPTADVPHIFERFHRARNVVDRVAGTGIGLAGARQIVEQHGGCIALETEEGQGSTFTVRLPLMAGDARSAL